MKIGTDHKLTTRDKILKATLNIIGNEGFQNVTIRKIASMAKVNIASINYHFGSKDNIINEALKFMNDKLIDSFKYLNDSEAPLETRLRNFLRSYADTALEYPDVFRNFISQCMNKPTITFEYIEFLKKEGLEKLKNTLQENKCTEDDDVLFMKIFQMISGLDFPILLGSQMKSFSNFDYKDKETRYKYIELLLESVLCK